jgi:hypothetical protein
MSWFRLDDQGAFHRKVVKAGNEAYGAWCRAGQWSACHRQNGLVPVDIALTIGPHRLWTRLITAGLLEVVSVDEYQIHDYLEWNLSAEELDAKSAVRSAAGARGGSKAAQKRKQKEETNQANGQAIATANEQQSSTHRANEQQNPTPAPAPVHKKEKNGPDGPPGPSGPDSFGGGPEARDPELPRNPPQLVLVAPDPEPERRGPAAEVFDAYVSGWRTKNRSGHPPVLTAARRKLIGARLKEFKPEHLVLACTGIWLDRWHVENRQTTIELALRDAGHIEKFMRVAEAAVGANPDVGVGDMIAEMERLGMR